MEKKKEKNQRPAKARGPLFSAFKSKFCQHRGKTNDGSFDLCRLGRNSCCRKVHFGALD